MNQNDINAARRLIRQFEDRATGRHNSNLDFGRRGRARSEIIRGAASIQITIDATPMVEAWERAEAQWKSAASAFMKLERAMRPKIEIPFTGSVYSRHA
jgi:hypothetical protein